MRGAIACLAKMQGKGEGAGPNPIPAWEALHALKVPPFAPVPPLSIAADALLGKDFAVQ
jgi:hypothetical protein